LVLLTVFLWQETTHTLSLFVY